MTGNNNLGDEANKSETISQLAHRHMKDQNHTTSDEELKNATIDVIENIPAVDDSPTEDTEDLSPDKEGGETHYALSNP